MVRRRTQNSNRPARHVTSPEEEIRLKREAFNKARDELKEAVIANKKPRTLKDDLSYFGHGAVRVGSDIINRGARVGDAFERDLRRHSLQGDIDQVMLNIMAEKSKGGGCGTAAKGTRTPRKPNLEIVYINGEPVVAEVPKRRRR